MRSRRCHRWIVAAVLCILVSGCGQPGDEPQAPPSPLPDELVGGWTALGAVPWDPSTSNHDGLWSGSEVVVAGGYDVNDDEDGVRFARDSYAFSPDTLRWRQLAPLPLDGYDGVSGLTGALTPTGWVGVGYPCTSGEITVEGPVSERCDAMPLLFGYTDVDGWTVRDLPATAATLFADQLAPWVIDVLGVDGAGQLILAARDGVLSLGIAPAALSAVALSTWGQLGVSAIQGACRIGDRLVTIAAPQPPPTAQDDGVIVPTSIRLITASLTAGIAVATGSAALGETTYSPIRQCLPGLGLLYSPDPPIIGGYAQLITAEGVVNWGAPVVQGQPIPPPLPSRLIAAGTELIQFTPFGGRILEGASGREAVALAATPTFELTVWTGTFLLAITKTSNNTFALTPDPDWPSAGVSAFPETFEPGD